MDLCTGRRKRTSPCIFVTWYAPCCDVSLVLHVLMELELWDSEIAFFQCNVWNEQELTYGNIGVLVLYFKLLPDLITLPFPACPDCCRYSSRASNQWTGTFARRQPKKNTCFLCCVSSHSILNASNEFFMCYFPSSSDSHGSYGTVSLGA
jgi:hypothetical protein